MIHRSVCLLALGAVGVLAPAAVAQEDCHCDCYFSSDCESGNFCNYGQLSQEDSCWWRQPKPRGTIGAGCNQDFGDWGRCDGICSPRRLGAEISAGETPRNLGRGVALWAEAMDNAARRGGGLPSDEDLRRIDEIDFNNPTMSYGLWRMVTEVMILSRGQDFIVSPQDGPYPAWEVGVAGLDGQPVRQRNGEFAVRALLAEMAETGSGVDLVRAIDASALDADLFGRICPSGDRLTCLYERIADMGYVLSVGAGGGLVLEGGSGPACAACPGDCSPNDGINFEDLLSTLSAWGSNAYPCEDFNQDGEVNFVDLLELLSHWGPCVEDGPPGPVGT